MSKFLKQNMKDLFYASPFFPIENMKENPHFDDMQFRVKYIKMMVMAMSSFAMFGMLQGKIYGFIPWFTLLLGQRYIYGWKKECIQGLKGFAAVFFIPLWYAVLIWVV